MMNLAKLSIHKSLAPDKHLVINLASDKDLDRLHLSKVEQDYVKERVKSDETLIALNRINQHVFIILQKKTGTDSQGLESYRKLGHTVYQHAKTHRITSLGIQISNTALAYAFAEGLLLSTYEFLKYKTDTKKHTYRLAEVLFSEQGMNKTSLQKLQTLVEATFMARNWVNEPNSYLTARVFASSMKEACESAGCDVQVFDKKEIEKMKMGGLLAVNQGSVEPPTFTRIEWKPKKARNKKPVVLVGKGVVYDTGGLSLKPTPHSMDYMKSDMAGGAAVAAALYALAKLNADVYVIGLIPATDNRPGGAAYAPGDVVKMMNGLHVEVLNTDAEGRMILADALAYSEQFKPELVINAATLTGAALRAIGTYGSVAMGTASPDVFAKLKSVGEGCYERLVEFPFWSEYDDEIKSEVADIKNLGSDLAGAITAGKFLAHFTKSPFVHLDIAGPSYLHKASSYRTSGGTGVGVRLFTEFLLSY